MTFPAVRTYIDEIPGTIEGTIFDHAEWQARRLRQDQHTYHELSLLFNSFGYLVAPIITNPSNLRVTLSKSSSVTRYIDDDLGLWEIPADLSLTLDALTAGTDVDRYDYLYLELYRYNDTMTAGELDNGSNAGAVGYRLNQCCPVFVTCTPHCWPV